MATKFFRYLLPLLVLLFAVALRVYGLDSVRHNFDAGYPHGQGITILEALQTGRWETLPALSLKSTVGIPNGAVASYLWAVIAVLDRSAYVAVFVSVLLNVLVVAQTYDITHKLTRSRCAAVISSALAATSLWGAWFARNTNVQGQLEFWTVTSAWLLLTAIERRSPRRLFIGFVFVAIAIHSYVVALIVVVQAGMMGLIAIWRDRRLLLPFTGGMLLCVVSISVYLLAIARDSNVLLETWQSGIRDRLGNEKQTTPVTSEKVDLVGWDHARRIVSSRDFEIFSNVQSEDFTARKRLNDVRATIVDLLLVGGMLALLASRRARVWPGIALLAWFGFPVICAIVVRYVSADGIAVAPFYLIPTSPAGYILAAVPFAYLDKSVQSHNLLKQGRGYLVSLACLGFCLASGLNWQAHIKYNLFEPLSHSFFDVPLRWQMVIGNTWRSQCQEIGNPEMPYYWLVSLSQGSSRLRWATASWNDVSAVWEIPESGGSCFTQLVPEGASRAVWHMRDVLPVDVFEMQTEGGAAYTYRAGVASNLEANEPSNEFLNTNIGWVLVGLKTPRMVQAGDTKTIVHIWRVVSLPEEDHAFWHYAPFVKLLAPDGKAVVDIDSAKSVDGFNWRAGDYIISIIMLDIPPVTLPGKYTLRLGLFDPNQKKSAVYLRGEDWSTATLFLERELEVVSPR